MRSLYRVAAVGKPRGRDRFYSSAMSLVEERVVVFKARDPKEAYRKARAEARKYASSSHRNPYGQRVRTRLLGVVDAYDMNDKLSEGSEVFSATEVVSKNISDRAIIRRLIGQPESDRAYGSRRNILNIAFMGAAPGVRLTARERELRAKMDSALQKIRRDA